MAQVDLYEMKMHQAVRDSSLAVTVIKVVGGWIYKFDNIAVVQGVPVNSPTVVFVPYPRQDPVSYPKQDPVSPPKQQEE